jgi:DNA repair exonuclease SbcCD ATPase subunit
MRDSLSQAEVHAQGCETMRDLIEEIEVRGDIVEGLHVLENMRSRFRHVQTAVDRCAAARKKKAEAEAALAAAQAKLEGLPARIEDAEFAKEKLLDEAPLPHDAKTRRAVEAATQMLTELLEEQKKCVHMKEVAVELAQKSRAKADAGLNDLKSTVIAQTDKIKKDMDELSKAFYSDVRSERILIALKASGQYDAALAELDP